MQSPKILLSGYFGLDNLGDEAIFEAMVHDFRAQCPEVQLSALVARPDRAQQLQVKTYRRKHLPSILQAMRECDLFVSGGGGLIQDSTGIGSVVYYLGLIQLAASLGKPTYLYAQGFGPVRSRWGRRLVSWLSPSIRLATFRDEDSLRDFRALASPKVPAFVTADPALLLPPSPPAELRQLLQNEGLSGEISTFDGPTGGHSGSGPLVAITLRPWPGLPFEAIASALRQFQQEHKARYAILAFHPDHDLPICHALYEALEGPRRLLQPGWTPAQIAGFLRCCDLIVGMRLHSLILAAGAQVPSIGLSYDPKVERFAQRAGAVPMRLENISSEGLSKALHHLIQGRHQARQIARPRIEAMEKAARKTTLAALELARGRLQEAMKGLENDD